MANEIDARTGQPVASGGLVALTHLIYGLHAFSAITGLVSAALIVTAFLTGTYLESHFRWQIRTFWFAVLWAAIALLLFVTILGIPFAWILAVLVGLWVLYRIVRGWLALMSERPMPL